MKLVLSANKIGLVLSDTLLERSLTYIRNSNGPRRLMCLIQMFLVFDIRMEMCSLPFCRHSFMQVHCVMRHVVMKPAFYALYHFAC